MSNKEQIGLSEKLVIESREKHGSNTLTPPAKEPLWSKFVEKLSDPIIIILLVALALSVGVAAYQCLSGIEDAHVFLEPAGIFLAVVLATIVGFYFEVSANRKFEILNKVSDETYVTAIRDGAVREVLKNDIVVGDIILLESGEEVPADCELLESISMQVNESTLTGEPIARKTTIEEEFNAEATYPSNYVMRGTTVVEGHAVARVVRVGDNTEYGKVYRGAQIDNSIKTPLNKQLDKLADLVTKASYAIATFIIVGRLWIYFSGLEVFDLVNFGSYLLSTVMIAVTVVVVSVPEGLPMSVTLSLALSMQRMLKANNLVRKMHACETMGATTVICTDKTGTLTQNKMQVYDTFLSQEELINESIAINTTAHLDRAEGKASKVLGNPTEGALLLWLEGRGVDYLNLRESHKIIDQLTFSTERKYMATMVKSATEEKNIIYVKGAPEVVISLSKQVASEVSDKLLSYQNMAMRTLAFASAEVNEGVAPFENGQLAAHLDLVFLGITAISDPIRTEVPKAISSCQDAGISVKIVTGDTSATAKEIGRQIGLWSSNDSEATHITGVDFEALSDEELLERVHNIKIMSRARPMDKQRLVQLLQQRGEVVAVTGDGTNDAPALKAAQIGLSMGDGTSVAKEASDITILDNSFSSIASAVMWGRSLYQNIQRFILFQMTINVVACLIVLIGAFMGTESPLTVTQMLWVNLIMDTFAALALASLPPSASVMRDAPRKAKDHIITRSMARQILGVGLLFVALLFSLVQYFKHFEITQLTDFNITNYTQSIFNFSSAEGGLSPYEMSLFFTIFVMLQLWNMFNARAFMSGKSALNALNKCGAFLATSLIIVVGQWGIVSFGGEMFSVVPLSATDWLIVICATSSVLLMGELLRLVKYLKDR